MNELIEKNQKPLKFCCLAVQILGWLLICMGLLWMGKFNTGHPNLETNDLIILILNAISWLGFDFFFVGLAAIISAQLARYIFERQNRPGLLLRCGFHDAHRHEARCGVLDDAASDQFAR